MKARVFFLCCLLLPWSGFAQSYATRAEAKAMVNKAVLSLQKIGQEKTFALINNPDDATFHDRDLYVFVMSLDGNATLLAHGVKPHMIGKNFSNFRDRDGAFRFREMVAKAAAEGEGWVDYDWPHPITQRMASKTSYVKKFEDKVLVGAGVYKEE